MIPVVTKEQMRQSDAKTIQSGTEAKDLMLRAGRGLFESYSWSGRTAIVCGTGNNAADGYVLALLLKKANLTCDLILTEERFSTDGRFFYDQCIKEGIKTEMFDPSQTDFSSYDQIVDCIYGIGFHSTVPDQVSALIKAINQSGKTVISADINSGLNANNGLSDCCVRSDLTVSLGSYKTGHFLNAAKDVITSLKNADIGIPIENTHIYLTEASDFSCFFANRKANSHKGTYGYVTVMGGCPEYSGAVKLSNLSAAALRAGCGVAQLAVPRSIAESVAPYLLESTLLPLPCDEAGRMCFDKELLDRLLKSQKALAIGMGWGRSEEYQRILSHILSNGSISLIIDADGLNTLAEMDLSLLRKTSCKVALTPHLKEFERLSGRPVAEIQQDPVGCAEDFAHRFGVVLLLKGSCTVVTDGKITYLVNRGCAGMATAGSGDVLSGILAGLHGYHEISPLSVACGAYIAGRAGEIAQKTVGQVSMVASDTVSQIARAIREIQK